MTAEHTQPLPSREEPMPTPAGRARRWALIHLGLGLGLVVGSLIAALLVIARDYGVIVLHVRTGAEVQR